MGEPAAHAVAGNDHDLGGERVGGHGGQARREAFSQWLEAGVDVEGEAHVADRTHRVCQRRQAPDP